MKKSPKVEYQTHYEEMSCGYKNISSYVPNPAAIISKTQRNLQKSADCAEIGADQNVISQFQAIESIYMQDYDGIISHLALLKEYIESNPGLISLLGEKQMGIIGELAFNGVFRQISRELLTIVARFRPDIVFPIIDQGFVNSLVESIKDDFATSSLVYEILANCSAASSFFLSKQIIDILASAEENSLAYSCLPLVFEDSNPPSSLLLPHLPSIFTLCASENQRVSLASLRVSLYATSISSQFTQLSNDCGFAETLTASLSSSSQEIIACALQLLSFLANSSDSFLRDAMRYSTFYEARRLLSASDESTLLASLSFFNCCCCSDALAEAICDQISDADFSGLSLNPSFQIKSETVKLALSLVPFGDRKRAEQLMSEDLIRASLDLLSAEDSEMEERIVRGLDRAHYCCKDTEIVRGLESACSEYPQFAEWFRT